MATEPFNIFTVMTTDVNWKIIKLRQSEFHLNNHFSFFQPT